MSAPKRMVLVRVASWRDEYLALPADALPFLAGALYVEDKDAYGRHDYRDVGQPVQCVIVDADRIRPEDPPTPVVPDPPVVAALPAIPPITSVATDAPGALHCPPLREFVDEFRHDEVPQ